MALNSKKTENTGVFPLFEASKNLLLLQQNQHHAY